MRNSIFLLGLLLYGLVSNAGEPGKQNYMLRCAGCHLVDGAGSPDVGIPDLRGNVGLFLNSEEGRQFLIKVPGVAHAPLSDKEITLVVHWMLKNFSANEIPADFQQYTTEEVRQYRNNQPGDVMGMRKKVVSELVQNGVQVK